MAKSFGETLTDAMGGEEHVVNGAAQAAGEPTPAAMQSVADQGAMTDPALGAASAAVQPPAVQPPAAAQPAESQQPVDPFLQLAQEFGFQNFETPEQARDAVLADYRQRRDLQAQYDRALEQARGQIDLADQAQQWYSDAEVRALIDSKFYARQAAAQQSQGQQPQSSPSFDIRLDDVFNVPSVDPNVIGRYRTQEFDPATGKAAWKWVEGTPLQVRQQYEEAEAQRTAWAERLVHNPAAALQPALARVAEVATQRALQQFREEQRQQESQRKQAEIQEKFRTVDNWVYEMDPTTGQPRVNPYNPSTLLLSPAGAQAAQLINELQAAGLDPARAWELARSQTLLANPSLAMRVLNLGGVSPQPAAPQAPQTPGEAFMGGVAAAVPAAAATVPATRQTPASRRQNDYLRQRSVATPPSREGIEQPNGRPAGRGSFGDTFLAAVGGAVPSDWPTN